MRGAAAGGVLIDVVGPVADRIRNSIIWGNSGGLWDLSVDGPVELEHSDVGEQTGPVVDLGGNINANPLLLVSGREGRLRSGSPAIDAGTCTGAPATDFEGAPRPSGASCDMGADEFVP